MNDENIEKMRSVLYDFTGALSYGIVITTGDPEDPRVIYVNSAFTEMTGYSEEEFIGKNPNMLQGEKTDREVIKHLKHCLLNTAFFIGQTYNYTKSGEPYYLKWCISAFSFRGSDYFFAIQKYLPDGTDEESVLPLEDMKELFTRWNKTIPGQMQNMLGVCELMQATEDDQDIVDMVSEARMRMEFLGSIARLNNYIINAQDDE